MTIKGPLADEMVLGTKNFTGAQGVDIDSIVNLVAQTVEQTMENEMGMPVSVSRDEYKVGGGLFSSGVVSPAVVFSSKENADYAQVFVSFKRTGGILEVMVAQKTPTSRNYQKVAQGKLFSDKAAAQAEDTYYGAITQAILGAIEL